MQLRRKLERMRRNNPVVVVRGGHQSGRVARSLPNVVHRTVSQQVAEHLRALFGSAVVVGPTGTRRKRVVAQHVQNPHRREGNTGQFRTLCYHSAHQQSAVGTARKGQILGRCDFLCQQVFRCRHKIIEHVLFLQLRARLVPDLAVLTAAAQIGNGQHASVLQPHHVRGAERRRQIHAKTAVSVQNRGVFLGVLQSLLVRDHHGDFGAILTGVKHLVGNVVRRIKIDGARPVQLDGIRTRCIAVLRSRSHGIGEGEIQLASVPLAAHPADGSLPGQRHRNHLFAVHRNAVHHTQGVFQSVHEKETAPGAHRYGVRPFRNNFFPLAGIRTVQKAAHQAAVGRAPGGLDVQTLRVCMHRVVLKLKPFKQPHNGRVGRAQILHVKFITGGADGRRDDQKSAVFRYASANVPTRCSAPAKHQHVLGLGGAHLVEKKLVLARLPAQRRAALGLVVRAVVKPFVPAPRQSTELYVAQGIFQRALWIVRMNNDHLAPVGSALAQLVGRVRAVGTEFNSG